MPKTTLKNSSHAVQERSVCENSTLSMLYRNSVSIVVVLDFSKYQLSYCFRNDRVWKNVKLRPVSFRFVARNGLCENPRSYSSKSGLEQLEGCSAVWENSLHSAISGK